MGPLILAPRVTFSKQDLHRRLLDVTTPSFGRGGVRSCGVSRINRGAVARAFDASFAYVEDHPVAWQVRAQKEGFGVHTGILAAGRLQSLIDSRDYSRDVLLMNVQLGQILDAVKSTVPQEMWGAIIDKLDQAEQPALGVDDETDYDEDVFDPGDYDDVDDDF